MTEIDIAVSCYNSAAFIDALFESIVVQEGPRWRIVAFNDGSKDGTAERLSAWRTKLGLQMMIVPNPRNENFGINRAYSTVLAATRAPWVLIADADDMWLPGRLTTVCDALLEAERDRGTAHPIVACSDARVVDEHQALISPSFWKWDRSDPRRVTGVVQVAMESPVLGPTMAVNRALLDLALPIPANAAYQDWWIAMVAAAFGTIVTIEEPTILYRRHRGNVTANPIGSLQRGLRAPGAVRRRVRFLLEQRAPQATAFVQRYGSRLSDGHRAALEALGALPARGPIRRRVSMIRHRLLFASTIKTCGMLLLC